MIKIFHRPRKRHERMVTVEKEDGTIETKDESYEDTPTSKFSIKEDDSGVVTVDFETLFLENKVSDKFQINKNNYLGKVVYCTLLQSSSSEYRVVKFPIMETATSASLNEAKAVAKNETPLARFCFEENGDINVFFYHRIDNVEGGENIIIKSNENSFVVLREHSAVFAKKYQKFNLKANMLNKIDQLNTLVYLEVQIDAMANLLLRLWKESHDEPDDNVSILEQGSMYSVLNVKSLESCLEEINNNKALVRKLQQQYIEQKQELCD